MEESRCEVSLDTEDKLNFVMDKKRFRHFNGPDLILYFDKFTTKESIYIFKRTRIIKHPNRMKIENLESLIKGKI